MIQGSKSGLSNLKSCAFNNKEVDGAWPESSLPLGDQRLFEQIFCQFCGLGAWDCCGLSSLCSSFWMQRLLQRLGPDLVGSISN